ncbi:hypothetical protein RYX36_010212 [Vicia faba]
MPDYLRLSTGRGGGCRNDNGGGRGNGKGINSDADNDLDDGNKIDGDIKFEICFNDREDSSTSSMGAKVKLGF